MRCYWMKSSIYLIVGLVVMFFMLTDLAEAQREILTIGKAQSPILRQLKGRRAVKDGRALVKEVKEKLEGQGKDVQEQRKKEKDELKNRLKNADAVVADLSEIMPTEDDALLAEAAMGSDVPIVLEKVSGEKMADLLGMGVDADLAVLESAKGKGRLHLWKEPDEVSDDPEQVEEVELKLTPEQKAELEKQGQKEQEHPPVKLGQSKKDDQKTKSYGKAAPDVEDILKNKPFSRGAKAQAVTGCTSSRYCREWESYWNPYYWNPGGWPSATLADQVEVGMYRAATNKYVVIQNAGGIWCSLYKNSWNNKGYFIEKYVIENTPTSLPPSWVYDRSRPDNANNQTQIITTWGFDLTASYPPSMGIGIQPSETQTLSDWSVTNQSRPPTSKWTYFRSKGLVDMWGRLASLPRISTNGWQGGGTFAETRWKGPANSTGYVVVKVKHTQTMRRNWLDWYFFAYRLHWSTSSVGRTSNWYFNTNRIY